MKTMHMRTAQMAPLRYSMAVALAFTAVTLISLPIEWPVVSVSPVWAQAVTFADETFNNSDWQLSTTVIIEFDLVGGGEMDAFQEASGGNPGAFRRIASKLTIAEAVATVIGFHRNMNAVYNPSTQGAIGAVDFSIDTIHFSGVTPASVAPALIQNGEVYFAFGTRAQPSWTTISRSSLTRQDFTSLNFTNPDFSKTGGEITFGFIYTLSGFPEASDFEFNGGVDNWLVTVTSAVLPPSPEPDSPIASSLFIAAASGSQVIQAFDPNVKTNGTCLGTFRPIGADDPTDVAYRVQCFGVSGVTDVHLHLGNAHETGPIVATLFPSGSPTGAINGLIQRDEGLSQGTIPNVTDLIPGAQSDTLLGLMALDQVYLQVNTETHPAGEVRGHVVAVSDANIVEEFFIATGSGSQQRPNPVQTSGTCLASFRVKGGDRLKYKVKCWGIEGVTQVSIHAGSAGETGNMLAALFPPGEATGPVRGIIKRENGDKSKGSLADDDVIGLTVSGLVQLMKSDGIYVNVLTAANPLGEVRGQVTFVETLAGF